MNSNNGKLLNARVVKHRKGGLYKIVGTAVVQTKRSLSDYDDVVVYQDINTNQLWVRPRDEFIDGRFTVEE